MVHDAIGQKNGQFRVSPKTSVYVMRVLVEMDAGECAFFRLTLKPRRIPCMLWKSRGAVLLFWSSKSASSEYGNVTKWNM